MTSSISRAVLVIATLAPNIGWGGVLIETLKRDRASGKTETAQIMEIQSGQARMEAGNAAATLFKDDAMYILDAQSKTYTVLDRAAAEKMGGMMNDAMAQMRQQMASMPPEQRAMMENMMKQRGMSMPAAPVKHTYDAKATGATESVAGRSCKVWNVTRDGALWQQVCVVPFNGLPGKDEFQTLAERMRPLLESLTNAMSEMAGDRFSGSPMQAEAALSEKLNGAPFITRMYRDGALSGEEFVIKTWTAKNVAADRFQIPAGYTRRELPTQGMPGNRKR